MGQKLVVGPVDKGLRTDRLPFNIDNDSFPTLVNAYQWRGRAKRKRGTALLARLSRFFNSLSTAYNPGNTTFNLVAGAGNILTGFTTLQMNASIAPGTVIINDVTAGNTYTDNSLGTLTGTPTGTGTINYATGAITITGGGTDTINANFTYYPTLPVMGEEDLALVPTEFPGTIAFDTTYSYNISTSSPFPVIDVSFYKNPPASATLPGYTQKAVDTPVTWNGNNYQQFWTTNYQGAFWATNGISVPFDITKISMQFKPIVQVTVVPPGTPPAVVNLEITGHGLMVGDFLFINEVVSTTGINFQTGYVTVVVDANNVTVEFPLATIATNSTADTGIAQYLTNRAFPTKDNIRWYDGDPTTTNNGWVNFSPPLSERVYSISGLPLAIYYLVGARMILPFKDRLVFLGPVVQTSAAGAAPIYLQDTAIFSQVGTPFYTASFTNEPSATIDNPTDPFIVFQPMLVPVNQVATPCAFFADQTGFGGAAPSGVNQPITTASANEDTLILGYYGLQQRFVYTGTDLIPFGFFTINSELGSGSTFSAINMDQGVITRGARGYIITNQTSCQRIDLDIPDQVFEIALTNNGNERFCATRDFINEWIYFTYPSNTDSVTVSPFPNQTLQYNYRDRSWAIFNECYTTYGQFRAQSGFTWATVGNRFPTWSSWNEPWNAGTTNLLQPDVIAGTPQGFIMIRDQGTSEGTSIAIQSFSGNTVTSPNHCLNNGDYIIISGCLGTIGYQVNSFTFSVFNVTVNTFMLNPAIINGTYLGLGLITRLYVPFIQTKQFPVAWADARKTRIGPQQYLLTKTFNSQIQLLIFLSQNADVAYNTGLLYPNPNAFNNALIYSTILFTCPESTNLGLTPANINLQMVTGSEQSQIWHRMNTSLIGDSVQIGFTISDAQMRNLQISGLPTPIFGATNANPAVLTNAAQYAPGTLIQIKGVVGMTQLNGQTFNVISSTISEVTIGVDSTAFGTYVSGGSATSVDYNNSEEEVEIHGFILDVNPSMVLA